MNLPEPLINKFWPRGPRPNVWAIFDCARDPRIYHKVTLSGLIHECLFAGDLPTELQHTAPYLVQLEMEDRRSDALILDAIGNAWCVFLESDAGMKSLRKHLRTFLRVIGPSGKPMLFRYYDPRVLRVYLPTCRPGELDQVFGPIHKFWTEEESGFGRMLQFQRKEGLLETAVFDSKVEPKTHEQIRSRTCETCRKLELKIHCSHKFKARKVGAGRGSWTDFWGGADPGSNPRAYEMRLPGARGPRRVNDGVPVFQVLAGDVQMPDAVTVQIVNYAKCADGHTVGLNAVPIKGSAQGGSSTEERPLEWKARAKLPVALPGPGVPVTLSAFHPFRWNELPHNAWKVSLDSCAGRSEGVAIVEAYPDVRWVIDVSLRLGRESNWEIAASSRAIFDNQPIALKIELETLLNNLAFLSTLKHVAGFLARATVHNGIAPLSGGPALSLKLAAEPYEDEEQGLVGFQWKCLFAARSLIGPGIAADISHLALAGSGSEGGAPIVRVLQALRDGIDVGGVSKARFGFGISVTASDGPGFEMEWSLQPNHKAIANGGLNRRIEFDVTGRTDAEFAMLAISAGAGVRIGAKTVFEAVLAPEWMEGDRPALAGRLRWEGLVVYSGYYYGAGLTVGPLKGPGQPKTTTKALVLSPPQYWPKASTPRTIGRTGDTSKQLRRQAQAKALARVHRRLVKMMEKAPADKKELAAAFVADKRRMLSEVFTLQDGVVAANTKHPDYEQVKQMLVAELARMEADPAESPDDYATSLEADFEVSAIPLQPSHPEGDDENQRALIPIDLETANPQPENVEDADIEAALAE